MTFSDDIKKVIMAGVGAVSVAAEKVPETLDALAKRGEETLEQGKVLNEQLRHEIKQAVKENVTVMETTLDKNSVLSALDGLTPEELKEIRAKLDSLSEKKPADEQSK